MVVSMQMKSIDFPGLAKPPPYLNHPGMVKNSALELSRRFHRSGHALLHPVDERAGLPSGHHDREHGAQAGEQRRQILAPDLLRLEVEKRELPPQAQRPHRPE